MRASLPVVNMPTPGMRMTRGVRIGRGIACSQHRLGGVRIEIGPGVGFEIGPVALADSRPRPRAAPPPAPTRPAQASSPPAAATAWYAPGDPGRPRRSRSVAAHPRCRRSAARRRYLRSAESAASLPRPGRAAAARRRRRPLAASRPPARELLSRRRCRDRYAAMRASTKSRAWPMVAIVEA